MGLTVKGQAITSGQQSAAQQLLQTGASLKAPAAALVAIIYAGMGESDLDPSAPGGGILQGTSFPNPSDVAGEARAFFLGGQGFAAPGAIACANRGDPSWMIANETEVNAVWISSRGDSYASQFPGGQAQGISEAQAIVSALGGGLAGGGISGLGGTGTTANPTSPSSLWTVGNASNPDQDYFTTINQYSQNAQWYTFSDGETLYVADGVELMAQQPQAVILRTDPAVVSTMCTYDNCLALDTPIPTPDGWTTMGDLQLGDMVFASDGKPTRVLGTSKVHTDHDCYRVKFSDGTSIVADDGHLWETVATRRDEATTEEISHQRYLGVRSTKRIFDTQRVAGGRKQPYGTANHRVKVARPLDPLARDLPVDPYVLGHWLGDGTVGTPIISMGDDVDSIVPEIERAGYAHNTRQVTGSGWARKRYWRVSPQTPGGFSARLRSAGVLHRKHIPSAYLRASAEQRLALLQGFMDSDGTIGMYCCLCLADRDLALDALDLIRGLGFVPTWTEKPARGTSRRQYVVQFATRQHVNAFRLPRKAARYEDRLAEKTHGGRSYRTIRSVEPVPSVPVKCIEVATADHLYLAGEGMVPTHNTAFQYASTHKKRGRIQRKSSLAKLTSPTEVTIRIICDIDLFRAGDVAYLKLFGPADGLWLIGNATRSVYQPYTDLTLVQAMQPINASTGTTAGPSFVSGAAASAPTAGTVIAAMVKEATTINNADYTYVWGGGHGQAGTPSIGSPGQGFDGHTKGFDCSGAVGAVLAAGGLMQWGGSVPGDAGIPAQLVSQSKAVSGQGSGSPECTIFDNPGTHIFMRLDGAYWGTADGVGNLPATPNQGAGWIPNGQPGSFIPYHIPGNILGQQPGPGAGP